MSKIVFFYFSLWSDSSIFHPLCFKWRDLQMLYQHPKNSVFISVIHNQSITSWRAILKLFLMERLLLLSHTHTHTHTYTHTLTHTHTHIDRICIVANKHLTAYNIPTIKLIQYIKALHLERVVGYIAAIWCLYSSLEHAFIPSFLPFTYCRLEIPYLYYEAKCKCLD